MAKKRMNETLREQRRAHAELLELKKANSGEITLKNEHPIADAMPKTFGGKLKNYLYHYKIAIIIAVVVVALATFAIVDAVNRVKPDIELVSYSYNRVLQEQIDCIAELMLPYCKDINGDGEIKLTGINCSFDKGPSVSEIEYSSSTHFHTLISGDPQAILFLLDEASYQHLVDVNEGKTFIEGEPLRLNEELYATVKEKTGYELPKGLMLCYRSIKGSIIEKEDMSKKCYKSAKVILEKMSERYPADVIEDEGV